MDELRYGDLVFDKSLLSAQRGDEALRFTRQERALLALFTKNGGRLLSRARILDAISAADGEISDRNVDFLVNRLRNKLGDQARAPRFIATQYGEGYIWIARPDRVLDAFLVIGPCYGLTEPATEALATSLLSKLRASLHDAMEHKHNIAVMADWRPEKGAASPPYSLDASLHADGGRLHGAFVLRSGASGEILQTFRAAFPESGDATEIEALAGRVHDAIWAHRAMPSATTNLSPSERPLELRMHDAALLLSREPSSWGKLSEQTTKALSEKPDDPTHAIMRGMALYADLIQRAHPADTWAAIESEIEDLALGALPAIQDNPLLTLGAAKLLFFIQRGHFELANELADAAFERSTAFGAAFSTRAQMRMSEGAFEEAHRLYDKAIELSEPGSEFHVYLLVLKATALLAAGDRAAVDALCAEIFTLKPMARMQIGLFVVSPDTPDLPPDLEGALASLGKERAAMLLLSFYNGTARQFHSPRHRQNVMKGLLTHATRLFGSEVVPAEIRASLSV